MEQETEERDILIPLFYFLSNVKERLWIKLEEEDRPYSKDIHLHIIYFNFTPFWIQIYPT